MDTSQPRSVVGWQNYQLSEVIEMEFKHVVVVHGIGDQKSNETVIGFMNEFIRSMPEEIRKQVHIHNLVGGPVDTPRVGQPAYITIGDRNAPDYVIAFSEVYWQPVTNKYLEVFHQPPIPIFPWAHSVNTRLFHGGAGYRKAREAIDNLETMLGLIRRLATIYKKSGQLADILEKFLGDVEMYVESRELRDDINQRFFDILERDDAIAEEVAWLVAKPQQTIEFESRKIYVVAHSEGTVVAYFSLVQAAGEREANESRRTWLPRVSGLVTMGSPLDKHYSIWQNRFVKFTLDNALAKKIDWYNYADRSDPVGMDLDVLRKDAAGNIDPETDANKMFVLQFDKGFARYPIPGKAHTDYWTDREIHLDILHKVLGIGGTRTKEVKSRWWGHRWIMSPLDYAAWAAARLVTIAALIFFFTKILEVVRQKLPAAGEWLANLVGWMPELPWLVIVVVAAVALLKFVGWIEHRFTDSFSRKLQLVRRVLFILILAAASLKIAVSLPNKEPLELKDAVGFLSGLVVTSLLWKLHTVIHKGLIQMWRYTTGWKGKISDVAGTRSDKRHRTAAAR
jgi:hypothetical protein